MRLRNQPPGISQVTEFSEHPTRFDQDQQQTNQPEADRTSAGQVWRLVESRIR